MVRWDLTMISFAVLIILHDLLWFLVLSCVFCDIPMISCNFLQFRIKRVALAVKYGTVAATVKAAAHQQQYSSRSNSISSNSGKRATATAAREHSSAAHQHRGGGKTTGYNTTGEGRGEPPQGTTGVCDPWPMGVRRPIIYSGFGHPGAKNKNN